MRKRRHAHVPIYDEDLVAHDAGLAAKRQSSFLPEMAGRKARIATKEELQETPQALSNEMKKSDRPSERWAADLRIQAFKAFRISGKYEELMKKETSPEILEGLHQRRLFGLAEATKLSDLSTLSTRGVDGLIAQSSSQDGFASREEALKRAHAIDGGAALRLYARDNGKNPIEEGGLPSAQEFAQMAPGGKEQAKALQAMRSWLVEDKRDLDGSKGKGAYVARRQMLDEVKKDPFGEKALAFDKQLLALDVGGDNPVKKLLSETSKSFSPKRKVQNHER